MIPKLKRENLNIKAYQALKKMIMSYYFKPGERINIEQVAKELEVSRTPVWEAVRRLEQEGLVINSPNKQGVFMYVLSREEALDLIAVRETLEAMAARLVAEKIDDKIISKLEKLICKQEKIVASMDIVAYSRADASFHELIYEAAGNAYLTELLHNVHSKLRPISMHAKEFMQQFYDDHVGIVEALKIHDPDLVEKKVRAHTQDIMRIIRSGELTFIAD